MIILKLNTFVREEERKRIIEDLKEQFKTEPFVLIPVNMSIENNPERLMFICDGRACEVCHGGEDGCHYTQDVTHAKNFKNVMGAYIEQEAEQ